MENFFQNTEEVVPVDEAIDNEPEIDFTQELTEHESKTFSQEQTNLEISPVEEIEKLYSDEQQVEQTPIIEEIEKHYSDEEESKFKIDVNPINETLDSANQIIDEEKKK